MKNVILLLILLLPVILLSYSWHVNHDGSGDFLTIQNAIDNVALTAGDSIIVWSSVDSVEYYPESLYIERDISFTLCSSTDEYGNYLTENTYICGDSLNTNLIQISRANIDTAQINIIGFTISHLDEISGRGIFITGGDSLTTTEIEIVDCDLVNNSCVQNFLNGGGIYINNNNPVIINQPRGIITISNCAINNNDAYNGGGLYMKYCSDELIIENSQINDNTAYDSVDCNGGGIGIHNSTAVIAGKITISNTQIDSNFGGGSGGGLYTFMLNASINLTDCTLENNQADSGGGIKFKQSGKSHVEGINIVGCEIKNNSTTTTAFQLHNGGGIYVWWSNITIEETIIDSNFAETNGGGLFLWSKYDYNGCELRLINSDVCYNYANGSGAQDSAGGGICSLNSQIVNIEDVDIKNNNHLWNGGGIAIFGSGASSEQVVSLSNIQIEENLTNGNGGGIILSGIEQCYIDNSNIVQNSNKKSGSGLFVDVVFECLISNCEISNNSSIEGITSYSGLGGGVYLSNCCSYTLQDCVINENSNDGGSAISMIGGDYCYGDLISLLICDNYQSIHPDTLGAIAIKCFQVLDIDNCTICNNYSDTTCVDYGGISYGSSYTNTVEIKESILWNNSGDEYDDRISENGITFCDIEDLPFTGNGCFEADPLFADENSYYLHWLSPCIDAGDNSESDPDGSYPDLGYKYYHQDYYNWEYNGARILWEWKCFPKMMVRGPLNTGQYVSPDSVLTNWVSRPDSINIVYNNVTDWLSGVWDEYIEEWDWLPNNNREISSTMGMKIYRDTRDTKLYYRGGLCEEDTELSIEYGTENWLGYFLKESKQVSEAIPGAVMDSLLLIKTYRWSMSRSSTDQNWVGTPSYTFNYGDLVILKTVSDTTFCWEQSSRSGDPVYRPFAEHYEYEEKSDYIPVYAILDPANRPDEIALFVDGTCKGAEKVDADTTQLCAYILEEEIGQNIEFELYYGGRQETVRYNRYHVHDQSSGKVISSNLYTGMLGDYYLVSFEDSEGMIPSGLEFGCYPNPFNPGLNICFSLPEEIPVEVNIYNIKGQKVRTLVKEQYRSGEYELVWDGRNTSGKQTGSGVYFIRIKAGKENLYRKAVMIK